MGGTGYPRAVCGSVRSGGRRVVGRPGAAITHTDLDWQWALNNGKHMGTPLYADRRGVRQDRD